MCSAASPQETQPAQGETRHLLQYAGKLIKPARTARAHAGEQLVVGHPTTTIVGGTRKWKTLTEILFLGTTYDGAAPCRDARYMPLQRWTGRML